MKRNKFLISTVLEKQDIPSDYCSKLGSEYWRLDRITWDVCAEDCSKSFKTKNHVNIHMYYFDFVLPFPPQKRCEALGDICTILISSSPFLPKKGAKHIFPG